MKQISTTEEIAEFNKNYDSSADLMRAAADLSPDQVRSLALDLVWKFSTKDHQRFTRRGVIKRAILEAYMRPVGNVETVTISTA